MGFDPNQPRDERGRWATGGGAVNRAGAIRMGTALRRMGVQIRRDDNYRVLDSPINKGPILSIPSRSRRRMAPEYYAPAAFGLGHEVGHILSNRSGGYRGSKFGPPSRIDMERQAWARGLKWLRGQGIRPDLRSLRRVLSTTLATYGSGEPYQARLMTMGTPRQRRGYRIR